MGDMGTRGQVRLRAIRAREMLIENLIGPYYMLAFPVNGTPSTQYIGDSVGQLSWTANHEPGAYLAA